MQSQKVARLVMAKGEQDIICLRRMYHKLHHVIFLH